MSDEAAALPRGTAGALLRAARERQGLHIAALAASIKVSPRKLDALENDRFGELPDATFTRALAQTVCRSLKIDPAPVLALLPLAETSALDHVSGSLNEPFRERPGRDEPAGLAVAAIRPMAWAGLVLLLAAVAVYFVPASLWKPAPVVAPVVAQAPAAAPAFPDASAAAGPASAGLDAASAAPSEVAASVPVPVAAAPPVAPVPSAALPIAPAVLVRAEVAPATASSGMAGRLLQLHTDQASWIEVRDGQGQVLLSRLVLAGESVGFDGATPFRLTIGNAPATRLLFRGNPVDLTASTRDSVARLELQ